MGMVDRKRNPTAIKYKILVKRSPLASLHVVLVGLYFLYLLDIIRYLMFGYCEFVIILGSFDLISYLHFTALLYVEDIYFSVGIHYYHVSDKFDEN